MRGGFSVQHDVCTFNKGNLDTKTQTSIEESHTKIKPETGFLCHKSIAPRIAGNY